jgi:sugar-specific transcriptional regulator TrmB
LGRDVLEALGFSPVEEQVYDLLVARGCLTLAEVMAEGDVKLKRQLEALDTLVSKGLVRRLAGPDQEFVVAPPEYAIEVLIAERLGALQLVRESAAELAARVRRVTLESDPGSCWRSCPARGRCASCSCRSSRAPARRSRSSTGRRTPPTWTRR